MSARCIEPLYVAARSSFARPGPVNDKINNLLFPVRLQRAPCFLLSDRFSRRLSLHCLAWVRAD
ncbi:hypothetical protein EON66_08940 [archaeon]|nr:MAG: hypothetical protein EON66_08940 [archaeon]